MMQSNLYKNIEKIINELDKLNSVSKLIIKYGTQISFAFLLAGTILFISKYFISLNYVKTNFISKSIIQTSFTLLAESIVGGLVTDFIGNRLRT